VIAAPTVSACPKRSAHPFQEDSVMRILIFIKDNWRRAIATGAGLAFFVVGVAGVWRMK
jgi:hypothetical protein